MTAATGRYEALDATRRTLGEPYLLGAAAVLAAVSGAVAVRTVPGVEVVVWLAACLLPVCGLVGVTIWPRRAGFDRGRNLSVPVARDG